MFIVFIMSLKILKYRFPSVLLGALNHLFEVFPDCITIKQFEITSIEMLETARKVTIVIK